jgi:hypothetical protein
MRVKRADIHSRVSRQVDHDQREGAIEYQRKCRGFGQLADQPSVDSTEPCDEVVMCRFFDLRSSAAARLLYRIQVSSLDLPGLVIVVVCCTGTYTIVSIIYVSHP